MLKIPKILWQSYISIDRLPVESLPCMDSWLRQNPGWRYHFCSDAEIEKFFRVYQGGRYFELFEAMPLPVMKADLWRYAVMEQFGGFYADIDTYCFEPLDDWLDRRVGFHFGSEGNRRDLCQWAFAAASHHPILSNLLELIRNRVEQDGGVNETIAHYVHHYTGPGIFSEAIQSFLGVTGKPFELEEHRALLQRRNVRIYPPAYLNSIKIRHFAGSLNWCDVPGYESWQRQRKDVANRIV